MTADREQLLTQVRRLPVSPFGYHRGALHAHVAELESAEREEVSQWQEAFAASQADASLLDVRLEGIYQRLASAKAERQRLVIQLDRLREAASWSDRGSEAAIEALRQQHALRMEAKQAELPLVEAEIEPLRQQLATFIDAVRQALLRFPDEVVPVGRDVTVAAATLLDGGASSLLASLAGAGPARIALPSALTIETRAQAVVGTATALHLHGTPLRILGYECVVDGSVAGAIPSEDVLAVKRNRIIVASNYRLLSLDQLPITEGRTLYAVADPTDAAPLATLDAAAEANSAPSAVPAPGSAAAPVEMSATLQSLLKVEDALPAIPSSDQPDAAAVVETPSHADHADSAGDVAPEAHSAPPPEIADVQSPAAWEPAPSLPSPSWTLSMPDLEPAVEGPSAPPDANDSAGGGERKSEPRPAPAGSPSQAFGADVMAFLTGKIVGADITDASGALVARRGEVIHDELVKRVEAAGRLPELIVHMTLPGGDPSMESWLPGDNA